MVLAFNGFFPFNLSFQGPRELQKPNFGPLLGKAKFCCIFMWQFFSKHGGRGRPSWTPWMRGPCFQFILCSTLYTSNSALAIENQKEGENFV